MILFTYQKLETFKEIHTCYHVFSKFAVYCVFDTIFGELFTNDRSYTITVHRYFSYFSVLLVYFSVKYQFILVFIDFQKVLKAPTFIATQLSSAVPDYMFSTRRLIRHHTVEITEIPDGFLRVTPAKLRVNSCAENNVARVGARNNPICNRLSPE